MKRGSTTLGSSGFATAARWRPDATPRAARYPLAAWRSRRPRCGGWERASSITAWLGGRSCASTARDGWRDIRCVTPTPSSSAARSVGQATQSDCPICEVDKLVLVTYAFGPRLPAHGRCITDTRQLHQLNRRSESYAAYVVEVCPGCSWHHLLRVLPLGSRPARRTSGTS